MHLTSSIWNHRMNAAMSNLTSVDGIFRHVLYEICLANDDYFRCSAPFWIHLYTRIYMIKELFSILMLTILAKDPGSYTYRTIFIINRFDSCSCMTFAASTPVQTSVDNLAHEHQWYFVWGAKMLLALNPHLYFSGNIIL